jgi:Raf kinase inhibitor-like YbhB/YbcL family protein
MAQTKAGLVIVALFMGALTYAQAPPLIMTSTAWRDGADIPLRYTRAAVNPVSPTFKWANTPPGTKSFVFVMRDLDAGGTDGEVLWLLWNIPFNAFALAENMPEGEFLPSGSRQIGKMGAFYGGPDAPSNGPKHRFSFELLALDVSPNIEAFSIEQTWADLTRAMQDHVLGKAAWTGVSRRPE